MKEPHSVLFLDFDGVLIPSYQECRKHNLLAIRKHIAFEKGNEQYLQMDPTDIGAFLYDCPDSVIGLLKTILEAVEATIVVISSWRLYDDDDCLRALFALHDLESRFEGAVSRSTIEKASAIRTYLNEHEGEIAAYVVIDDSRIRGFEQYQVKPRDYLKEKDAQRALGLFAQQHAQTAAIS